MSNRRSKGQVSLGYRWRYVCKDELVNPSWMDFLLVIIIFTHTCLLNKDGIEVRKAWEKGRREKTWLVGDQCFSHLIMPLSPQADSVNRTLALYPILEIFSSLSWSELDICLNKFCQQAVILYLKSKSQPSWSFGDYLPLAFSSVCLSSCWWMLSCITFLEERQSWRGLLFIWEGPFSDSDPLQSADLHPQPWSSAYGSLPHSLWYLCRCTWVHSSKT